MEKVFIQAISKFGANNQKIVAIEELSELQKEICKDLRGQANLEHIAEEMADAEIMIAQLKLIYGENLGFTAKLEEYKVQKVDRLLCRMKEVEK